MTPPPQKDDQSLEGSTTKYLPLDDDSKEPSPVPPPLTVRDPGSGSDTDTEASGDEIVPKQKRKEPKYVKVEHLDDMLQQAGARPKPRLRGKKSSGGDDGVTYVKISEVKTKAYKPRESLPPTITHTHTHTLCRD